MQILWIFVGAGFGLSLGYWWGQRESRQGQGAAGDREKALLERAIRAESDAIHAQASLADEQPRLEKLRTEFSELAGRLLEEKSGKLREEAQSQLSHVLAPFKQNLDDLKAQAARMHTDEQAASSLLRGQVEALALNYRDFNAQAANLSLTLKGNSKAQGAWGEVVLARVLSASGLRDGQEYVLQGKGLLLKADGGEARLPDAVVFLPEGRQVVIDSKASLTAYFKWTEAKDEAGFSEAAKELVASLKAHIKGLGEKDYTQLEGLRAPEFTLMFMPLEPALGVALSKEPELFTQAWEKRVVIVGPNTLFSTLKVVDQIWGQERRSKNAEEIARKGGTLYDKFVGFVEDLKLAVKAQDTASAALKEMGGKLYEGKGNLVRQAEELRELGVKNSKRLPEALTEKADQ